MPFFWNPLSENQNIFFRWPKRCISCSEILIYDDLGIFFCGARSHTFRCEWWQYCCLIISFAWKVDIHLFTFEGWYSFVYFWRLIFICLPLNADIHLSTLEGWYSFVYLWRLIFICLPLKADIHLFIFEGWYGWY